MADEVEQISSGLYLQSAGRKRIVLAIPSKKAAWKDWCNIGNRVET